MAEAKHSMQRHLAVGNINLDITLSIGKLPGPDENVRAESFWVGLGGAATNYAIAVAKLGHKPFLVARAGREARALGLLDKLREEGVDVSFVRVVDEPIGVVVVLLISRESVRSMITMRGANEGLRPEHVPGGSWDIVHFASVRPEIVKSVAGRARLASYDPGGEVFVDPSGVREAAYDVDIVMLNSKELEAVTGVKDIGKAAKNLIGGKVKFVVVKKGRGGAVLYSSDGLVANVNSFRVERPVDVTGAGDAFDAAFNVWLLETGDPIMALKAAVAAGSAKTTKKGSSSMPTRREVEEMLASSE